MIKSDSVKLYSLLLMMVTGPYTAYDSLLRNSMASSAIRDPNNMHNLFLTLGLTTVFVNTTLLPKLQSTISTQTLLSGSFSLLAGSYLYLAVFHDLIHLFIGMPIQVGSSPKRLKDHAHMSGSVPSFPALFVFGQSTLYCYNCVILCVCCRWRRRQSASANSPPN